jgi:hypothetical protein
LDIRRGVVQQTTQDFTKRHAAHFDSDVEPIVAEHELVVRRNRESGNSTNQAADSTDGAQKPALLLFRISLIHARPLA